MNVVTMRLCHAAEIVLVGWYLMVPPLVNAPYKIDTEAALTSWNVYQTFDTEEKCRKSLSSAQSKYEHTATGHPVVASREEHEPSHFRWYSHAVLPAMIRALKQNRRNPFRELMRHSAEPGERTWRLA